MGVFYYDGTLSAYEFDFLWDHALGYLEKLYAERKESRIINTLVGFSWFYLIEGPIVSKKYADDQNNRSALNTWRKYIDLGAAEPSGDPFFYYIAGYTLSLHGSYISEAYEKKGIQFVKTCLHLTKNTYLRQLAENFLMNENPGPYRPVRNGKQICEAFFDSGSLLDQYFYEVLN